ncbi:MAG: hypothetical protein F7C37_07560 [Desulfurococcales archaeon]|nr:hypothetical protein [Desulfurococcales archaeon]
MSHREDLKHLSITATIILALIILSLALPLVVFLWETMKDPYLLSYNITYKPIDLENVEVNITLTYKGHIKLTHYTMTIYGKTLDFGDITRGTYTKTLTLSTQELTGNKIVTISFKVAGLYKFTITSNG